MFFSNIHCESFYYKINIFLTYMYTGGRCAVYRHFELLETEGASVDFQTIKYIRLCQLNAEKYGQIW